MLLSIAAFGRGCCCLALGCDGRSGLGVRTEEAAVSECESAGAVYFDTVLVVTRRLHDHSRSVPLCWVGSLLVLEKDSLADGQGTQWPRVEFQALTGASDTCPEGVFLGGPRLAPQRANVGVRVFLQAVDERQGVAKRAPEDDLRRREIAVWVGGVP